ncbi:GIY-YIG nuclease family protein [Nostoc sp. CENA67]|uniref:GIY-YIG nuclease family protein n=1 Tax=Amazonocrinis nigriterrae CENA67 TaxID=2794033 RepID=A0A8J7LAR8_9NOST|nr:GIY-YIG nuclease family protein [Amazonocrinis nigriterrae]MBH8564451.1 GIY-YIG nuclease family protein [Amazonocrinis nigriterrae CENA67]
MWLRYGIDQDKTLVSIEDVPRGKTQLRCPYCNGELTAKKGKRKEHHFAHTNETCREVSRSDRLLPTLPLYDNFNIWLTGKELKQLKDLWERYGVNDRGISVKEVPSILIREKLLEHNPYRYGGEYQFTKLGKIPVGALSLMLFNQVQEPLLIERLQELEKNVQVAYLNDSPTFNECLRDLQIYQAEFRKILSNTLYYLQIDTSGGNTIYKIGVTRRDIETRVAEIKNDLASHFENFSIKVLGTWPHRGNVEKYFKHRYSFFNVTIIGNLTEYYNFFTPEDAKAVLRDLRRMQAKGLSPIEVDILEGKPSQIEQLIADNERAERRSQAIKTGMERAKNWGQNVGRPSVSESPEEFLGKPSSQRIIAALHEGLSLRQAAEKADVAVNTVRKVKALLNT